MRIFKCIGITILVLILIFLVYAAYVFLSYYRLDDNLELDVAAPAIGTSSEDGYDADSKVPLNTELDVTSWNIGFAAYTDDFTFFMDGGEESRARSEESVLETMKKITEYLNSFNSDFHLIQEVDTDSTRSYHVNQYDLISEAFAKQYKTFAQNYDSPYLMYPILQPHGKSKAGIVTLSDYVITDAIRRSLPIQEDFGKLIDLDRCYSINRIPCQNGKELVLVNVHLSAYTTDHTIADQQLEVLYEDLIKEYEKDNYVVCGGDFNKDLLGDSPKYFGVPKEEDYSWAESFPMDSVPDGFTLVSSVDDENPVASSRLANMPWDQAKDFQITLDGFIVSDNIQVLECKVLDLKFECSDHNPVNLRFALK